MKSFTLAYFFIVSVSALPLEDNEVEFQTFKVAHGKTYINEEEESKRSAIYAENLRSIEEHNVLYEKGLQSWKQSVNTFSDITSEEFSAMLGTHLSSNPKPSINTTYVKSNMTIPSSIDWRNFGQVTEAKEQKPECGSCWAFSIAGSTEAAYFRKTGKLVSLSAQQLMDCSTKEGTGCHGGLMGGTFPYIEQNGLEADSDYPYEAKEGSCRYNSSKVVTQINGYKFLTSGDEDELLNAVGTVGPISAAMDANYLTFYDSGVYSNINCTTDINHGILIVGYGSEGGEDYWIIKNSWGSSWGANGYFKMLRGKNMCGIAQESSFPIIN